MARPRKRPAAVDTEFFNGVTPLWVGPNRNPIPDRFHAACNSLADWAGPNWSDNDAKGYFSLRHHIIKTCENWRAYDWEVDERLIVARKKQERTREILVRRTKAFRQSLRNSAFKKAERDLGISIVAALSPEAEIDLTYEQGCNAVAEALEQFEVNALRPDRFPVRYGPLLYERIPKRNAGREIAVALVLADLVTGFRKDEHRKGGLAFPRAPLLSSKLPWKAITEFSTAFANDHTASVDSNNLATRVKNLQTKVACIFRNPEVT
jgi:hypothetical protein